MPISLRLFFYRAYTTLLTLKIIGTVYLLSTLQNKNIGRFLTELARILALSVVREHALLLAIQRPEYNICGLRRSDLKIIFFMFPAESSLDTSNVSLKPTDTI